MRGKLGQLILTLLPLIKSAVLPPLEKFKRCLRICFPELKPQLSIAESFDDVMELVRDKCSIINIACMETIVDHYKIKDAEIHIAKYKSEVEDFCRNIKLDVCQNESLLTSQAPLLKCETIEFVLKWETDEHTLSEIERVLWKAFGDMAKNVLVKDAREGNSIIVTCYVPRHIMDILLMEAKKNLDVLIKMGLIQLTIGYHILVEKQEEIEKSRKEKEGELYYC